MRSLPIICLVFLSACGRPLTENETDFAQVLHGASIDTSKVRLVDGAPTRAVTFRREPRPRTTCRERLFPPIEAKEVTGKPAAVSVFNHVLFDREWYLDDYLPEYPDQVSLVAAMLFAHEMTHVWQWQNRRETGYSPWRAAVEHGATSDPYLFELNGDPKFSDFGYEQQGSIMEEYVCCRALDPTAPRTTRLHEMLAEVMPVQPLPQSRAYSVGLPWDGVEIENICR